MECKENIHPDFIIDYSKPLGEGAFGEVFRGIWVSKNCFVAIKRIKQSIKDAKKIMDEEVKNILNFLAVVESKRGTFLVIEYCEGGCLDKEILKGIPEINCFKYLKEMVDGMETVNQALHIHRDIKPENILFTKQKILKICDFGLARRIIGDDPSRIEKFSAKGTPLYASPQILNHQQYSARCDVWSVGVVLVQMLTKVNPFGKATNFRTLKELQYKLTSEKGHYVLQGNYNPWFIEIVSKMLVYSDKQRWSFKELKQKIDKDYFKVLKTYQNFSSIKTEDPIAQDTRRNQKKETVLQVPGANTNVNTQVLKFKRKTQSRQSGQNQKINTEDKSQVLKLEKKLLTRQENKELLTGLRAYVQFIYSRGKLFTDVATKYFQIKQNPKSNGYKFIVLFLSISTFLKSIEKIYNVICKQPGVVLPDGTQINYENLDSISKGDFQTVQNDYKAQMKSQFSKFTVTLNQIELKMLSKKYAQQYPELIKNIPEILQQITKMKNNVSQKKPEQFEQEFRKFFKTNCIEDQYQDLTEGFLRLYWMVLILANINTIVPIKNFRNTYTINQLIDNSSKLPLEQIKKGIKSLHKTLNSS